MLLMNRFPKFILGIHLCFLDLTKLKHFQKGRDAKPKETKCSSSATSSGNEVFRVPDSVPPRMSQMSKNNEKRIMDQDVLQQMPIFQVCLNWFLFLISSIQLDSLTFILLSLISIFEIRKNQKCLFLEEQERKLFRSLLHSQICRDPWCQK